MNDTDDYEVGIYRSTFADVMSDVAEADTLVHILRSHGVTAGANSVTFVLLDD